VNKDSYNGNTVALCRDFLERDDGINEFKLFEFFDQKPEAEDHFGLAFYKSNVEEVEEVIVTKFREEEPKQEVNEFGELIPFPPEFPPEVASVVVPPPLEDDKKVKLHKKGKMESSKAGKLSSKGGRGNKDHKAAKIPVEIEPPSPEPEVEVRAPPKMVEYTEVEMQKVWRMKLFVIPTYDQELITLRLAKGLLFFIHAPEGPGLVDTIASYEERMGYLETFFVSEDLLKSLGLLIEQVMVGSFHSY